MSAEKIKELKKLLKEEEKKLKDNKNKELKDNKQKKLKVVNPSFVKMKQADKVRFFTKYLFEYKNITNDKQFFDSIKDAFTRFKNDTDLNANSSTIYFKSLNNNKIRFVEFNANDFKNYNIFIERLNKLNKGEIYGSDVIDENNFEIIYNNFAVSSFQIQGKGKSNKMIFKCVGIEETKIKNKSLNNCAKLCLQYFINNKYITSKKIIDIINDIEPKKISLLDDLKNFIINNNLKINIVANSFTMKNNNIFESDEYVEIPIADKNKNIRKYFCYKLDIDNDIDVVYFHYDNDSIGTIIIDEFNKHYDVILDNKMCLCDDVYISLDNKIIKNNQILFTPKQINFNSHSDVYVQHKYLFFDYETVINFSKSSCMQEYSLSMLCLTEEQLKELDDADKLKDIEKINYIREKYCKTILGFDCSKKFIQWIIENQANTVFTILGYNSSSFDNFILLNSLLNYSVDIDSKYKDLSITDIFYNGNQLLNFKLSGRHHCFDLNRHLMGSLKNNCESFKINCCSKKEFDHNHAQQLYLENKLIDYINKDDKLKEYNEYDVLSLAVLFKRYKSSLEKIDALKPFVNNLHDIKTIGSLIYKVFNKSTSDKKINLPKLNKKKYLDLLKYKCAGRVQLFNGIQKITERLVSTDVCSLYPFVMAILNVYYPCGEIIETDKYMGDDKIGFYYCDIDQSNLKKNNLPNIYAEKTEIENKWDSDVELKDYLISNVMIRLLKKYNCKINIKSGFFFSQKKKSCDMFDFMLDFMKAKNEQDDLKKNNDELYNPAMRETLKLLMNSLSGKVIEQLHIEITDNIKSLADFEKIKKKSESINFINNIGNELFITYKKNIDDLLDKQKPIYLGCLIYDYAKEYMFEYSYSKIGLDKLIYTDTDASKFRYADFINWKKNIDDNNIIVPHWKEVEKVDNRYKTHKIFEENSKIFGSFDDELSDCVGDSYLFYCLQKKSWMYAVYNNGVLNNDDKKFKAKFKGLTLNNNTIIPTLKENFITLKKIKHEDYTENKFVIEYNDKEKENNKSDIQKDIYNYFQDNKDKSLENKNNVVSFFDTIYNKKEIHALTFSFRKIVKNNKKNVSIKDYDKYNNLMNNIQVIYSLKHIKI